MKNLSSSLTLLKLLWMLFCSFYLGFCRSILPSRTLFLRIMYIIYYSFCYSFQRNDLIYLFNSSYFSAFLGCGLANSKKLCILFSVFYCYVFVNFAILAWLFSSSSINSFIFLSTSSFFLAKSPTLSCTPLLCYFISICFKY